jgi:hypothetical protein
LTFRSPSPLAYRHSYRHSSIPNHNQPVHFIDKVFDACARLYLSVDCSHPGFPSGSSSSFCHKRSLDRDRESNRNLSKVNNNRNSAVKKKKRKRNGPGIPPPGPFN